MGAWEDGTPRHHTGLNRESCAAPSFLKFSKVLGQKTGPRARWGASMSLTQHQVVVFLLQVLLRFTAVSGALTSEKQSPRR